MKFYYNTAPNPMKVALFLEEAGIEYEPIPIDSRQGAQFNPDYLAINPNAKSPSLVDGDITVFDSNAILLYLGEKSGKFMGNDTSTGRGQLYSWLMFVATGIGPYSGQAVHFQHHASEKIPYAINRYVFEAERHYNILDDQLSKAQYMLGEQYSIVDMCVWGWARMLPLVLGEGELEKRSNLKRLVDEINARPAAERALTIKDRHGHAFKTEMDAQALKFMFPQNARLSN
ncbi:glutathione S-transferase N-terminal domain-containing protein [Alphaproteobacteria bacterium]|jgi:GST-like protein|nr:glutathione S-transferase [Rhodospirillaceae bacterium]MBT7731860.1 glutathione S-transferase family protein [Rhodospirillaceae bacterium]MDC0999354.1 glutathione S-transferase N-terminal domain-containing protein [Alphaproteobacteria bacterium]MDG1887595.1 glutathione S-transferase N-terminal domain-containing protein [Alphaproteobacteria bacterium]